MLAITSTQEVPVQGERQVIFTMEPGSSITLQVKNGANNWITADVITTSGICTMQLDVPVYAIVSGTARMDIQ